MRSGRPIPAAILNAPSVSGEEQFYFAAYFELATCRNFERGQVPWTAIIAYMNEYKIARWHRETFMDIIMTLDIEWLAELAKRDKARAPPGGKKK